MIAPYKRILIAALTTSFLHASIFYTLSEVKQPKIAPDNTIEISLMQTPQEEKKELQKEKKIQQPKPVVKPKPKPIAKPKPAIKPKAVTSPKPIEVLEEAVEKVKEETTEDSIEKEVVKQEPLKQEETKSVQNQTSLENEATASSTDILDAYLYKVRQTIQANLRYPPLARRLKIQGESVISFYILSDGSVEASTIKTYKSSGNSSLDKRAIDTILQVSPFDVPPQGKISIIVPVAFNLR